MGKNVSIVVVLFALFIALRAFALDNTPEMSPDYLTCAEYRPAFNDACSDFMTLCEGASQYCPVGFEPIAREWDAPRLPYCYPGLVTVCNEMNYYSPATQTWIVADCCATGRGPLSPGCGLGCPGTLGSCSSLFCGGDACYMTAKNNGMICSAFGDTCDVGICH